MEKNKRLRKVQKGFLERWIEIGKEESDVVDQFFDYYVVFNYLFEQYSQQFVDEYICFTDREIIKDREENDGVSKSKPFDSNSRGSYNQEGYKTRFFLNYLCIPLMENGFSPDSILSNNSEMVKCPVEKKITRIYKKDGQPKRHEDRYLCTTIDLNSDPVTLILSIFDNIYGIRCNLFHGSKFQNMYHRDRDLGLITEASELLENLLDAFMSFQFDNDIK